MHVILIHMIVIVLCVFEPVRLHSITIVLQKYGLTDSTLNLKTIH